MRRAKGGSRVSTLLTATLLLVAFEASSSSAVAEQTRTVDPSSWPSSMLTDPDLDTWPNAMRIWGSDRYQTSLAASFTLRGSGGYPYQSPDPAAKRPEGTTTRPTWVGAGRCPRSIIIVAGDSPADALTATSLSDASGYSSEPYLRRVAAADPLFDPIGGYKRVDTDFAPIILTQAARNGATELSPTALMAARDMRSGGCVTARDAIIVGGWSAVPVEAEQQLLTSGYDSVFRVFGKDRFGTAAAVANALGTSAAPEGISSCLDEGLEDGVVNGAFYRNSVIEWRTSPGACELLQKTVVLADGVHGIDALAAGWWTSFWQVPVLLHDGSESLPSDTALALQTLEIDNVIVLGGTARISSSIIDEVQRLVGNVPKRIAGANRYDTSVAMARYLGGWWDGGVNGVASGASFCVVGSSGQGRLARGWPDALTAGAWCAANSWAASGSGAPERMILPASGLSPRWTDSSKSPSRVMSPILLVNPTSDALPGSVRTFLSQSYNPAALWCSSLSAPLGCNDPGFAVIFGGAASVPTSLIDELSIMVAGDPNTVGGAPEMLESSVFLTDLDMSPLFHQHPLKSTKICGLRGAFSDSRWILADSTTKTEGEEASYLDLAAQSWYRLDSDGQTRSPGISSPGCVRLGPSWDDSALVWAVGPDGRRSELLSLDLASSSRYQLSSAIQAANPVLEAGIGSHVNAGAGETRLTFSMGTGSGVTAKFGDKTGIVGSSSITLTIRRGGASGGSAGLFDGSWNFTSNYGTAIGQIAGEARIIDGAWHLLGRSTVTGGSWPTKEGFGGFSGVLNYNSESPHDDVINWQIDGTLK